MSLSELFDETFFEGKFKFFDSYQTSTKTLSDYNFQFYMNEKILIKLKSMYLPIEQNQWFCS